MDDLQIDRCDITISLVKINEKEIKPMLLIKKSKNEIMGFRIIPNKKGRVDCIHIGKKYGINFDASILTSRIYKVSIEKIIKTISVKQCYSDKPELNKILNKCRHMFIYEYSSELVSMSDLYKELKKVNRKIEICKFNNKDYSQLERRRDGIIEELGFEGNTMNKYKKFDGYRVAPNKGYIKIYGLSKIKQNK